LNSSRQLLSDGLVFTTHRFSFEGVLFVVLGTIVSGAGLLGLAAPKTYQAVVRTRVSPPAVPGPYFLQTEFEVISSQAVLGKTIEKLKLREDWVTRGLIRADSPPREALDFLKRQIQLRVIPNTDLIEMRVQTSDPVQAAKIANTLAETFQAFRVDETRRVRDADAQAAINSQARGMMIQDRLVDIVDVAAVPRRPIRPNRPFCVTAGFFGLLLVLLGIILEVSNPGMPVTPAGEPKERTTVESG
jgi:uncharacterized protein involved in exopolysaccharide biosynthesis